MVSSLEYSSLSIFKLTLLFQFLFRTDIARLIRKDLNRINEIDNTNISKRQEQKKKDHAKWKVIGKVTDVEIFVRKRQFYNINFSTEKVGNYQEQKRYTKVWNFSLSCKIIFSSK